jgi:hypothetical protein
MPVKRTTLPPELMAEWADERAVGEVSASERAKWRCSRVTCRHEWMARVPNRLCGRGRCPICTPKGRPQMGVQLAASRGAFRQHSDFHLIKPYVHKACVARDTITIPCQVCDREYKVKIYKWLQGTRRHKECVRKAVYRMPPGMSCAEPEKYSDARGNIKLLFQCSQGHRFRTALRNVNTAAVNGTPGCPQCSSKAPISSRLSQEAPDILAVGAVSSPASAVAILSALGKSSHKEIAAYKRMLEMQQGGMSASEAIAEMTKRGDDLDADDVDSDIDSDSDGAPDLDEPQLDAWNKQRVDNLFDALGKVDRLFVDGAISDETAYQFLVDEQVAVLWNAYCDLESKPSTSATTPTSLDITTFVASVREQASSTSRLLSTVAQTFLRQHDGAAALHVPVGFKPRGGEVQEPKPTVSALGQEREQVEGPIRQGVDLCGAEAHAAPPYAALTRATISSAPYRSASSTRRSTTSTPPARASQATRRRTTATRSPRGLPAGASAASTGAGASVAGTAGTRRTVSATAGRRIFVRALPPRAPRSEAVGAAPRAAGRCPVTTRSRASAGVYPGIFAARSRARLRWSAQRSRSSGAPRCRERAEGSRHPGTGHVPSREVTLGGRAGGVPWALAGGFGASGVYPRSRSCWAAVASSTPRLCCILRARVRCSVQRSATSGRVSVRGGGTSKEHSWAAQTRGEAVSPVVLFSAVLVVLLDSMETCSWAPREGAVLASSSAAAAN